MRVLLSAVLTALLLQARVHADPVEPIDTSAQTTGQATPHDTVARTRAPWEPVEAPKELPGPEPKNNSALYGWGVAVLAAAGMTLFLWRSSKREDQA